MKTLTELKLKDNMDIELMGWIGEEMSDEDVLNMIDEIEAEEDAREELFDHFANEWSGRKMV
jgi:predicted CopG family antitoxin